jgi:hypothetical protein
MPLTPDQKSAYEQLKEQLPVDLVPGYSVVSSEVSPDSVWLKRMKSFSKDLSVNAYAYYNFEARGKGPLKRKVRKPSKIISPDGFPADIVITYAYPPPGAFYTLNKEREVKHFVMHSFGHMWNPGWMNSTRSGRGVQTYTFENKTVFVPKGSDPETLAHFTRFSSGLQACLSTAAKATAHFFIDRDGNLVVIGDCNDVLYTSQGVSGTSCGVELEEAFYVLKDTKGKGNKALWKPGGRPPGTAGNIEYFGYSAKQLFTLSILIRKLETVYPKLKERNIQFARKTFTADGPPGYTMHDFIYPGVDKNTGKLKSGHMDISPQYLTQELWDSFFRMVDSHNHINSTNVWKPRQKYPDTLDPAVAAPTSNTPMMAMTERVLNQAKTIGVAQQRSQQIANNTRGNTNTQTGSAAANASLKVSQQVATTTTITQQTQAPQLDYPSSTQPEMSPGRQVNSDDMWG